MEQRTQNSPTAGPPPGGPNTFFLRTKLLPPRPAPSLLPRPRLTERLRENVENPLTLVTANAGSGKTTLVAEFVRTSGIPTVWYQLDETDADPGVFLGYVATGLRGLFPGFGDATLAYLREAAPEIAQRPERAVDVLLNDLLETVEQKAVIVLDDYHHLGAETGVHRAVDRLIAYLPDFLHVIIVSRDMPPLSLARMRSRSALAVVDRAELLFTDAETQELFREVFGLELTPAQLAEYRERTHGWITALQLVREVAHRRARDRGGDAPDLIEVLRHSERDIFDYFAEEVFAGEPPETQRFLMRASLLDRIEVETCAALFADSEAGALLPALVRRNVFVTVASDDRGEEYRLHPLFRGFLHRRLRSELGPEGYADERRRCARHFAARREWERAVDHFLAAGAPHEAASVLAGQGGEWIAAGKLSSLEASARQLPAGALEAFPRALVWQAEASRLRGDYDAAEALFRRAIPLLEGLGDREGEAEALHSLATVARRRGDFDEAFAFLDRATALVDERAAVWMKCGNTRGLCLLLTGELAASELEFRAALQTAEERGDEHYVRLVAHNLGLPAMMRGDFLEALRWLRRMVGDGAAGAASPHEATGHLNIARCLLFRGDLDACERHLERSLERSQQFSIVGLLGEIFETYGNLHRERGDLARAADSYQRAFRAYSEHGASLARHELLEERALLDLQRGDVAAARAGIERLIAERDAAGDVMGRHAASLARGRILIAAGEHSEAAAALEPALDYFHESGFHYYEAQACMALAACERRASGGGARMVARLERALDLAARFDYEYWLRGALFRYPDVFDAAEAAELLPAEIRDLLPEARRAAPAPAAAAAEAAPAADLAIAMLGPVDIVRDPARPLAPDAWTTRRARDILCFIASRRGRRATKDSIVDTFWGESDFAAVEKNFHPTISHIRKALNSNQVIKQNLIVYRDGDYMLNPEFSYDVDVEAFDALLARADAARRAGDTAAQVAACEGAVALYRGEFMQGVYDEWVEEPRGYYAGRFMQALEALAGAAEAERDWARALEHARRILREDAYREDVHLLAMRAHAAMGNRVAVKEQFEALTALLDSELGVEPSAETRRAYRELLL